MHMAALLGASRLDSHNKPLCRSVEAFRENASNGYEDSRDLLCMMKREHRLLRIVLEARERILAVALLLLGHLL